MYFGGTYYQEGGVAKAGGAIFPIDVKSSDRTIACRSNTEVTLSLPEKG